MEKYLSEGDLSDNELIAALPGAVAKGTVVPMFCTAGKKDLGIAELLAGLAKYAVSPQAGSPRVGVNGKGDVPIQPDPAAPFLG
jgi:elongation factor G